MRRRPAVAIAAVLASCAPPAVRTTFLQSVDLVDMTDRMAESFTADGEIGARASGDDPWVISIDRVVNHTNQVIPPREKWLYVTRLRSVLARSDMAASRSLVWVVNPERWPMAEDELGSAAGRLRPTHLLAAEFHALTNTSGAGRTDAYLCSFQLSDVRSGRLVWEDRWEVKRAASGLTYD